MKIADRKMGSPARISLLVATAFKSSLMLCTKKTCQLFKKKTIECCTYISIVPTWVLVGTIVGHQQPSRNILFLPKKNGSTPLHFVK